MTPEQVEKLIAAGETMDVEFKGEANASLNDNALVEAVVCLCNRPGNNPAYLLVGVEDDRSVSGARPRHPGGKTDVYQLQALIANRTRPSQSCRSELLTVRGKQILVVEVPPSRAPVGTSDAKYVRRAMGGRGVPECVPFPFHEMQGMVAERQMQDYSTFVVRGASWDDLDPLEFQRFRRNVQESRGRGDVNLLGLPDVELAKALGAVEMNGPETAIRVLGLLLFGKEDALRRWLPTHEVAFQVITSGQLGPNEFFHWPLLRTMEELRGRLAALNREEEIMVGMLRVPVPLYTERIFREAISNSLVHRDYTRMGAVHIQWHAESLEISNPGGFPEGVNLGNLLTTPPRPRNLLLADAFKRAGLVDRTARGIDTLFEEQLRNGRPAPIYDRSTQTDVVLVLPGGQANLDFVRLVATESQEGRALSLDELLVLNQLWYERSLTTAEAAALTQKSETEARTVVHRLLEKGLIEARGAGKARDYHLSASLYRDTGQKPAYVRQRGFEPIQREQMVLQYLGKNGRITRREVADLCRVKPEQAKMLLKKLTQDGRLLKHGEKRGSWYELKP